MAMNKCNGGMVRKKEGGMIKSGGSGTKMEPSVKGGKVRHHAVHLTAEPGVTHHVHVIHHHGKKR